PPATTDAPDVAEVLFGDHEPEPVQLNTPESIRQLREADKGLFNPANNYADLNFEADLLDMEPAERAAVAGEYRAMLADLGMSGDEAREAVGLLREHTREQVPVETVKTWEAESHKRLQEMGANEADLTLARTLVRRDPRIREILNITGLGSHPQIVQKFVELARREKLRGRL
ncbi:MAG TPA: hypothetical protein VIN36_09120, partial [Thiobacillus sp.]